jgi:UDP-N-acetylmuramate--alanine ligase
MDKPHTLPMHNVRRIHFVGIGGAGMGGIAEVLHNLDYVVSGSDQSSNRMTDQLTRLGIPIAVGHRAENVQQADVVVYSSAIPASNVELVAARARRIPSVPRAEMLAELMRFRHGIAIAGTHGKTTTTSLVASVLAEGGLDPTFVIGGLLHSADSHARLGTGHYLVAEADESDASFLLLNPLMAVLTNIDADHMDTYQQDFERLRASFRDFFRRLPFYGVAVICLDDPCAAALIPELHTRVLTYGQTHQADVQGLNIQLNGTRSTFHVRRLGHPEDLQVTLNMPGRHNALNALAAIAIAGEVGVSDTAITRALANFQGVNRRCQVRGRTRIGDATVTLIDDYGHHPRELAAMIRTARESWAGTRLVLAFQPHRYTRTRDLFEDFSEVLSGVDVLLLLDIYSAGEKPLPGADARALCRSIRARGAVDPVFVSGPDALLTALAGVVQNGDLVMLLGAGSIGRIAEQMQFETQ